MTSIKIEGIDKLQKKIKQFSKEIESVHVEVFSKYAKKIEREAKEACPTKELKDIVRIEYKPDGNFSVKHSQEARIYVEPIVQKNTKEMHDEIAKRLNDFWQS